MQFESAYLRIAHENDASIWAIQIEVSELITELAATGLYGAYIFQRLVDRFAIFDDDAARGIVDSKAFRVRDIC